MSQEIEQDYFYELSIGTFPYLELFRNNELYSSFLFAEFKKISARPKLHLYFKEFISDEEWSKAMTAGKATVVKPGNYPVAASMVAMSDTEKRANEIIRDFQQMIIKNTVEPQYCGRHLEDSETIKLLRTIVNKIDEFKKYVVLDKNVDNYRGYATASISNIITLTNKLQIPGLGQELLSALLDSGESNDAQLQILLYLRPNEDSEGIRVRYNVLKTLADELLNKELTLNKSELQSFAIPNFNQPTFSVPGQKPKITLVDRVLRELALILTIYESQFKKFDNQVQFPYPLILNEKGEDGIDGRYIQNFDLLSNTEIFNIQDFKEQMTQRFEVANNLTLFHNQLAELEANATTAVEYYETKLTRGNTIVDDFLVDHARPFQERIDDLEKNMAVVKVYDHQIDSIYFGANLSTLETNIAGRGNYPFRYLADNFTLAQICSRVIDFARKFKVNEKSEQNNNQDTSIRYFSFDLNNYRFSNDPNLTAQENEQSIWKYRQIVLETIFISKFKKTTAENLAEFLDHQYRMTPAPKQAFVELVEKLGNANLHSTFQGSSIPKADAFRVWITEKKSGFHGNAGINHLNLYVNTLNVEASLQINKVVAENGGQVNIADLIQQIEPPKTS
ncbi:hypothetical protein [Mucilaginibacter polytrichastri]|uniref:Uncharacterized protein n=1 Tax=Mucilaginibacter polytrichastri TaxID=1302689 RepID=A0A1Q6A252_9SPHI|nr:hypothetical protein [Mucilaginibacter polytrichastri]OKS88097.1 hypothetical protein RG47T_3561 [Mucilaginibacter polytrichastri]SFT09767.1 hypothetical protein SAMN04487890_110144 [Mucilaginibacter polytrichastri]